MTAIAPGCTTSSCKPPVKKRNRLTPSPAEALAQEDVDPARVRPPHAQIGEHQRTRDSRDPAERPEPENPGRARHRTRQRCRREEDPDADHRADRDRRDVPGAEGAFVGHPLLGCYWSDPNWPVVSLGAPVSAAKWL